jgi:hypothetical protein
MGKHAVPAGTLYGGSEFCRQKAVLSPVIRTGPRNKVRIEIAVHNLIADNKRNGMSMGIADAFAYPERLHWCNNKHIRTPVHRCGNGPGLLILIVIGIVHIDQKTVTLRLPAHALLVFGPVGVNTRTEEFQTPPFGPPFGRRRKIPFNSAPTGVFFIIPVSPVGLGKTPGIRRPRGNHPVSLFPFHIVPLF